MDINQYLKRINFYGTIAPDFNTLTRLQHQHLFTVPFEDLDIFYGHHFNLDKEVFYNKVVINHRGGYCYELNSLFYELLLACGFKASMISGRVGSNKKFGPEFDHMALIVEIDNMKWLVDVGFGDFALKPLAIMPGHVQNDGRCNYRINDNTELDGSRYLSAEKWNDSKGMFIPEYIFTLTPRTFKDFAQMNENQQTDPESHFVKNFMCSLPIDGGRISMVNNRIIKTINGTKRVRTIHDDEYRQHLLKKYFDIEFLIPGYCTTDIR